MRVLYLSCVCLAAMLASSDEPVARKRRPEARQDIRQSNFRLDSTVVLVNVTVSDSRGRSLTGLPKEKFLIFEDKAAQTVRYFSAEESPISVGLVLDFSRSMSNKFS